jgi:SAM-dependent methyltransferase
MRLIDRIHGDYVYGRRVRVLAECLGQLVPNECSVLDVGCGDGLLDTLITEQRPDIALKGIEPVLRQASSATVEQFDGKEIPFPNQSFDVVMLIDVLHHTQDPLAVLRDAARVAKRSVLIKDHLRDGFMADATLRFMDRIGNLRHGVPLPYNYWSKQKWVNSFDALGLKVRTWKKVLGLYPWPAALIFERSLHFVTELSVT